VERLAQNITRTPQGPVRVSGPPALITHFIAPRLAKDRDFLGHDQSRDHLPQQKCLRTISGGREFALRANDMTALLGAVRAGLGLAVLPQTLACRDKTLRQVTTSTPAPTRDLWLAFHRDVRRIPAIRAVIDHLIAIVRSELAMSGEVGRRQRDRPYAALFF
jgi:DNA-binding transcriptional LysR family regulator